MRPQIESTLAIVFALLAFLSVAIWNGSPFYFWDSPDYIELSFSWNLPPYRTAPYGAFLKIARLTGTLWTVVIVQAAIVTYVLHETLSVFVAERAPRLLALLTLPLALLSGLPWVVGQIMADAMTGPVVLAVIALTFAADRLSAVRRTALAATLALAVSLHTSHMAIGGGLLAFIVAANWLLRRHAGDLRPRPMVPALALVAGVALTAMVHWAAVGRPFVTQPSYVLWLGRLVEDGIAQRFLDDNCRRGDEYKLCKWSGELPPTANSFLWVDAGAPYHVYGSWEKMRPEARRIVEKTLRDYPLLHLKAAVRLSFQQLIRFSTGDGILRGVDFLLGKVLRKHYLRDYQAWLASRQKSAAGIGFKAINAIHFPAMALAQLALIGVAIVAYRRRERMALAMSVLVIVALLGNAFVCGALSNPNDRYQSRLVWLAVVALGIGVQRLRYQNAPVVLPGEPAGH